MKRPSRHFNFDGTLDTLRGHGFDVAPFSAISGSALVSKYGIGAVVTVPPSDADPDGGAVVFAVPPGVLVRGEVSRLLDRGYQKFIKTSQYELPATASQLQAIHTFSEELKQLTGAVSLYNESLGTTSDVYRYDRLVGRDGAEPAAAQPWQLTSGANGHNGH